MTEVHRNQKRLATREDILEAENSLEGDCNCDGTAGGQTKKTDARDTDTTSH